MRITIMGVEVPEESLPPAAATELDDHFTKVTVSATALDRASQYVPEHVWKQDGLHRWLAGRANQAFQSLKHVNDREATIGRLKYVFEFGPQGPELKTLILL